jgi:hypothetical protein
MSCRCRELNNETQSVTTNSEICQFCGGEIIFRVIRGLITPIHLGEKDCEGRRLYRSDQEGIAHLTKCPRCLASVYFLRNNGGSIWLESLGWPWPKHGCFDDPRTPSSILPNGNVRLNSGMLRIAIYHGILKSGEGFVASFFESKKDRRRNHYGARQWEILCQRNVAESIGPLFEETFVIVAIEEKKVLTLNGNAFDIREHFPRYYSKFSR